MTDGNDFNEDDFVGADRVFYIDDAAESILKPLLKKHALETVARFRESMLDVSDFNERGARSLVVMCAQTTLCLAIRFASADPEGHLKMMRQSIEVLTESFGRGET